MLMKRKEMYLNICLLLKYLFAMLFPILAVAVHRMSGRYLVVALAEVLLIAFCTNLLCRVKNWLGYLFNVPALLFMNIQFAVLYWGSTFVSAVMLANLDSVNAISGKFFVYGLTVAMVLLFSFLPIRPIVGNKRVVVGLGAAVAILYAGVGLMGMMEYSPYHAAYMLYQQAQRSRRMDSAVNEAVSAMAGNTADMTSGALGGTMGGMSGDTAADMTDGDMGRFQEKSEFYSGAVSDFIKKPEGVPEDPNVIMSMLK